MYKRIVSYLSVVYTDIYGILDNVAVAVRKKITLGDACKSIQYFCSYLYILHTRAHTHTQTRTHTPISYLLKIKAKMKRTTEEQKQKYPNVQNTYFIVALHVNSLLLAVCVAMKLDYGTNLDISLFVNEQRLNVEMTTKR